MVLCDKCGRDIYMPFRCNYCGGYFCAEHRLPEFHDCVGLNRGVDTVNIGRRGSYRPSDTFHQRTRRTSAYGALFRFSDREIRDLAIGLILIAAIPLRWLSGLPLRRSAIVLGAVGIYAAAFLLHELAHKFSAQRFGYWAEFRLNMLGLMITLMSFFSPIMIVAPGAVLIAGLMFGEDYGKISLSGPLINIVQAIVYMFIYFTSANSLVRLLAHAGVTVNSSLALFNLIPFGAFDGEKILRWNWKIWLAAAAVAGLLFIYAI